MSKKIFPKEIIQFSLESHYFKFSRQSKSVYVLMISMIVLASIALPFTKVDISVQSRGMIRSQARSTAVQTPVTGQVQEIGIRENMKVATGDTLIKLSRQKINDQMQIIDDKIALYKSYILDLKTLTRKHGATPQSELLKSSYAEYNQKLKEYQLRIEMRSKDFNRTKILFEKDVIAEAEFEKKELELNQLIRERDFYVSQKNANWQQQLFQYRNELRALTDNHNQLKFEKRFYAVVAPADGFISNFTGVQTGSFIFPNQTIATISPSDNLIAECYVTPEDIGYLQKRKQATFQVDAYNYNQWGMGTGEIIDISNQPYQEDGTVYFKVKCKLNQDFLSLKSGYQGKLKNGLTLTSRFQVTRRSLYDLLFDKADDWLNPKVLTANN